MVQTPGFHCVAASGHLGDGLRPRIKPVRHLSQLFYRNSGSFPALVDALNDCADDEAQTYSDHESQSHYGYDCCYLNHFLLLTGDGWLSCFSNSAFSCASCSAMMRLASS